MSDEIDSEDTPYEGLPDVDLAYVKYPMGATLDHGRIVIDAPIFGEPSFVPWVNSPGGLGLWRGRQLAPRKRPLLVTYGYVEEFLYREWICYDTVGIAPLVFFGYLDGVPPLDEPMYRQLRRKGVYPHLAMAEARPQGEPLLAVAPLTLAEVVRLGLGLCDMLLSMGGLEIVGLRPETVYLAGEHGSRYYAGAAPRAFLTGGYTPGHGWLEATFDSPTPGIFERDAHELVYTVALLLWFGLLREHAFIFGKHIDDLDNRFRDIRAPFTGPPELGRLLEAVLVSDVERRMKAPELREELAKLAVRWNIEPPPFPPPGLT